MKVSFHNKNDAEKNLIVFKDVITKFLGNSKDPDYKNIVKKILRNFKILGCSMSIKIHLLHKDLFPENLGAMSE